MISITVKRLLWILFVLLVIIVVFFKQFNWLADFFIDPSSKVPDPGDIDIPIIN